MGKFKKLKNEFKYLFQFNNFRIRKTDVIVLCHDDHRQVYFKRLKYSPLTDSICDELMSGGKSVMTYALPYSNIAGDISYRNPESLNGEYARARLRQFIVELIFGWYEKNIGRKCILNFWLKIIKQHSASQVICVQPGEDLCYAGKLLNVSVIDVQHGLIDINRYYDSRELSMYGAKGMPDVVYCWDHNSMEKLKKNWASVDSIVYGHPFHNRLRGNINDFIGAKDEKIVDELSRAPSVLITLQYDEGDIKKLCIPDSIRRVVLGCINKGVLFGIKVHPVQFSVLGEAGVSQVFGEIFGDFFNKKIFNVSSIPLPIMLFSVNFHLSEYSASAIEASISGIKTGLWGSKEKINNFFDEYIKNGCIEIIGQDEAVIEHTLLKEVFKNATI